MHPRSEASNSGAGVWWIPFVVGGAAWFLTLIMLAPLNGAPRCRDGWASPSIGKSGACSWHGGVKRGGSWIWIASLGVGVASGYATTLILTRNTPLPALMPSAAPTRLPPPTKPLLPTEPVLGVACPRCRNRMIARTAKRGRNRGEPFWGCSQYPRCYGTRPYDES